MKTDVDTCLRDIAKWFVENEANGFNMDILVKILKKHCESEIEVLKFCFFLKTRAGQERFSTIAREAKKSEEK